MAEAFHRLLPADSERNELVPELDFIGLYREATERVAEISGALDACTAIPRGAGRKQAIMLIAQQAADAHRYVAERCEDLAREAERRIR